MHTTNRMVRARRDRITRASRVRLLARQVAAGDYHVDPDRLAAVLIERSLFHRRVAADLLADRAPHAEA